jgi:Type ISP C-terminal specificity domain
MPGAGRLVERSFTSEEVAGLKEAASALHVDVPDVLALTGKSTCDVYINEVVLWRNVPINTWAFTVGGYQVLKKWLSYRESNILGRSLTVEEAREFSSNARRITSLLLLSPLLDENYRLSKAAATAT